MHWSAFGSEGCRHLKFESEAQIVFFLRHTWFTTRARHTSAAQRCFLCQTSQQVHKRSVRYLLMWHLLERKAHHETPRQSEVLNFILDVAQALARSLFISRRTDRHLLTSANTLALCCCDGKVSFGSIKIPSRNELGLVWLREIPRGASHLQRRD